MGIPENARSVKVDAVLKVILEEHTIFKEARARIVPLLQTNIAIFHLETYAKQRLESTQNVFYERQAIPNGVHPRLLSQAR
jgi:hypothetical protein